MLVLTRVRGESLRIGDDIVVTLIKCSEKKGIASIGISTLSGKPISVQEKPIEIKQKKESCSVSYVKRRHFANPKDIQR